MNVRGLSGAHEARHPDPEHIVGTAERDLPPGVPG
jgi:hypothetical protein